MEQHTELHIVTGSITGNESVNCRWWAETTNLKPNIGVERTNGTEEECVLALVKSYFARLRNNGKYIPETDKESVVSLSEGTQS